MDPSLVSRFGTVRLTTRTTTDDYQLWAHGFALTASLYHARGALQQLLTQPNSTVQELVELTGAASGHLSIIMRTLSTVGWVQRTPEGRFSTTIGVVLAAHSDTLAALCADVYGEAVAEVAVSTTLEAWGSHVPRLAKHLPSIHDGWALPGEASEMALLPTLLAGAVIAPLLLELRMMSSTYTAKSSEAKHEHASAHVSLSAVVDEAAAQVGAFFVAQRWGSYDARSKARDARLEPPLRAYSEAEAPLGWPPRWLAPCGVRYSKFSFAPLLRRRST